MNCNNCKYKDFKTISCCVTQMSNELRNILREIPWLKNLIVDIECGLYEMEDINNEHKSF